MKKKRFLPITILLIILISACTHYPSTPIAPKENSMVINIKNNSNFDFYGIQVHILNYLETGINGNNSKIEKGDLLSFELLEKDMALNGEVEMYVEILGSNSRGKSKYNVPNNKKVTLELDNKKEVFFEITGDSIRQADLKRVK
ncbi:hypothetical protein D1B31_01485 [Neobacillus notoginsengisoli]|uniref:Lipoprotein n=1 Tax=Neobacillus notoginsengisoli TaxID=1578198 RepID=A0A417Z029_9BACI|nr:hypothetical protein [Neobacillus notoginsengisoli]RHW43364.1 hypothetical protein D1B31_01485 [Neobacillus notoginsengisoli]